MKNVLLCLFISSFLLLSCNDEDDESILSKHSIYKMPDKHQIEMNKTFTKGQFSATNGRGNKVCVSFDWIGNDGGIYGMTYLHNDIYSEAGIPFELGYTRIVSNFDGVRYYVYEEGINELLMVYELKIKVLEGGQREPYLIIDPLTPIKHKIPLLIDLKLRLELI